MRCGWTHGCAEVHDSHGDSSLHDLAALSIPDRVQGCMQQRPHCTCLQDTSSGFKFQPQEALESLCSSDLKFLKSRQAG